MYSKLEAG